MLRQRQVLAQQRDRRRRQHQRGRRVAAACRARGVRRQQAFQECLRKIACGS